MDLSDLLVDEQNNDLTDYLYFDLNSDGDTVIHISTSAGFDAGFDDSAVEQTIELSGVDLVTAFTDLNGTDQAALIQDLVNNGKLITD
ncbi:type I secretion C-terminal target domain-containing protein [Aliamphritea spongicola]|nr:type I secretion C-terminal target domain-containing protein [Aliamphritea spongicola]